MVELPDDLRCLFTARIEERNGEPVIVVSEREIELGELDVGETYRVAMLPAIGGERPPGTSDRRHHAPPVEEGDIREVEIIDIGEQGDGIAKVERGYVVIVPGTRLGDEVSIEITNVAGTYAIGEVIEEETPEEPTMTESVAAREEESPAPIDEPEEDDTDDDEDWLDWS